jgi:hypothetical protein
MRKIVQQLVDPTDPPELLAVNELSPEPMGDIAGKVVVIRKDYLDPEYQNIDRRFKAEFGFGTKPFLAGLAVFGTFLVDGEEAGLERNAFAGLAKNPDLPVVKYPG